MSTVIMIVAAVLVFGSVVFVHELGHFIAAKLCKIKVLEFAIGMGPAIFKKQIGETLYAIRLFWVGGYVAMEGEYEESATDSERSFQKAPIYKRLIVMLSGVFMNFVLGFVAVVVVIAAGDGYIASRTVAEVSVPDTGLQVGDVIEKVNGRQMFTFSDMDYEFLRTQNGTLDLQVQRGDEEILLNDVEFEVVTATDSETGEVIINESTGEPYEYLDKGFKVWAEEKTVTNVISEGFNTVLSYARVIYLTLVDLIAGRVPINQLSGPVGIVSEIGKATALGWIPVVQLLSLISVNLGVMNLLPLPVLDGGRVVLLMIEAVRRKPLPQKYETVVNVIGIALLLGLMLFVSFFDIQRILT